MTQDEINALGIAFFSGKILQFRTFPVENKPWHDWSHGYCPDFRKHIEWRVKPAEPKKEVWCTFRHRDGSISQAVKDSTHFKRFLSSAGWTHIPSLDREVILPEGFE